MSLDVRLARAVARWSARPPSLGGHFALDAVDHDGLAAVVLPADDDDVVQVGLAAGVAAGAYDGDVRVAELAGRGDLGIGTLQGLDGELVVVDGEPWSVDVEGRAHPADPDARVPFAVLVHLAVADRFEVDRPTSRAELERLLAARVDDPSACCAVRVDGRFAPVAFRSVRRQHPPYRPLAEVLATDQHHFAVEALDATMVGFGFPESAADLDFPGFHLHMLAADRSTGGHVFDFVLQEGTVAVGLCHTVHVELAGPAAASPP